MDKNSFQLYDIKLEFSTQLYHEESKGLLHFTIVFLLVSMKMNYLEANFVPQRLLVHSTGDLMMFSDMFIELVISLSLIW